jgi:hypothetical protein
VSIIGEDGLEEASYRTWEEAEAGHEKIVSRYLRPLDDGDDMPQLELHV